MKRYACVLLAAFPWLHALGGDGPIANRLERARAEFEARASELAAPVRRALTDRLLTAKSAGDHALAEQLELQLADFETHGRLPPATPSESELFERLMREAVRAMADAYETASEQFRRDGQASAADAAEDARRRFVNDPSRGWSDLLYKLVLAGDQATRWKRSGSGLELARATGGVLPLPAPNTLREFDLAISIERLEGEGPIYLWLNTGKQKGWTNVAAALADLESPLNPGEACEIRIAVRANGVLIGTGGEARAADVSEGTPPAPGGGLGRLALAIAGNTRFRIHAARYLRVVREPQQVEKRPVRPGRKEEDPFALGSRWQGICHEWLPNLDRGDCTVEVTERNGSSATLRITCDHGAVWSWRGRTRGTTFESTDFEQIERSKNWTPAHHRFEQMKARAEVSGRKLGIQFSGRVHIAKVDDTAFGGNPSGSQNIRVEVAASR